jgi:hypothetical protein
VGNERKLQGTWQSYPLRPQNIFILGASATKRLFINALLKLVAAFSSSKVIQRVSFVEIDAVQQEVPMERMPAKYGGQPSSVAPQHTRAWVERRLAAFPLPQI